MRLTQLGFTAVISSALAGSVDTSVAQNLPGTVLTPLCSSTLLEKRLPKTPLDAPADVQVTVEVCADLVQRKIDMDIRGEVNPVLGDKYPLLKCVTREMEVILDQEIQKRRALNLSPATLVENVITRVQSESERIIDACLSAS